MWVVIGYGNIMLLKKLDEINENDILIYLDVGCTINPKGKEKFNEYIELLNKNDEGIISFQLNHLEKKYTTKRDI